MLASYTTPDSLLFLLLISSLVNFCTLLSISPLHLQSLAVLTPFLRNRSPASTSWARGDCVCLYDRPGGPSVTPEVEGDRERK